MENEIFDDEPGFDPPKSYAAEAELQHTPPRPIPEWVRQGSHAKREWDTICILFLVGILCLLLSGAPFIKKLGLYILPLAYLKWIGWVLLAIAAICYGRYSLLWGSYQYIRKGIPVAVKITYILKAPSQVSNGIPTSFTFTTGFVLRHPESGELKLYHIKSPEFSADEKENYVNSLRPGDYVTALYFPGKLDSSLCLYGYLGLNPQVEFVKRKSEPHYIGNNRTMDVAAKVLAIGAIFGVLFWNLFAYEFFQPISQSHPLLIRAGVIGAIIGVALSIYYFWSEIRKDREKIKSLQQRQVSDAAEAHYSSAIAKTDFGGWVLKVVLVLGFGLMSALTVMCALFGVNAIPDTSKPEFKKVEIIQFTQTTTKFILRLYHAEFIYPGGDRKMEIPVDPEKIKDFKSPEGIIEIHEGTLHWPWIKSIRPAGDESSPPAIDKRFRNY